MYFTKTLIACFCVISAMMSAAQAAIFTFTGQVTEVSFGSIPEATNPPTIGEEVTFEIFIDDSDPTAQVFSTAPSDPFTSLLPVISITTAGGLTASIAEVSVSGDPTFSDTGYSLSTVGPGISGLTGMPSFGANLHSSGFSFDPFAFVDPTNPTVGEIVAAIAASSVVSGGFRAGTQNTDTFAFGSFRATFTSTDTSEVPLPGAALFFATGLIGAALKRRRATA